VEVRLKRSRYARICLFSLLALLPAGAQQPWKPKLVLVLTIDQMRYDYLTRFNDLYKGGLRTLIDRGAIFTNANYRHADTETGPGHSVILSGRHPSHSGIVANDWWDSYLKKIVNVVEDPVQSPVGGEGRGASPVNFLAFTVGDMLKLKSPNSHIVGISLKDRSAVLLAGHRGDAAYWYETAGGNFITSTYYMKKAPDWLIKWNGQHMADRYFGTQWTRLLLDERLYEKYAGKDAVEGEWDRKDTVFPHNIRGNAHSPEYYDDLRRTPAADEMTLSAALEAMKAHHLGEDDATDIFAIGFAGTDVIGHTYGPDSQEQMDELLRLDRILDQLLKEIDAKIGLKNTIVILTADHGVLPLVENLEAKGSHGRRAKPSVLEDAVRETLQKRFPGVPDLMVRIDSDFYLREDVIRQRNLDRGAIEQTAIAALMSTGFVEKVYTHSDLSSHATSADPYLPLFRNAFFQPRSPHLMVLVKPYTYIGDRSGGTGHGTAHDYDRHVPIVFMGKGIKPGSYSESCGPEDIAPTLALLLALTYPLEEDSRLLKEMIQ
jgi:predicted AlkP superfamily pyrophosphatase or phosphodiesterase